MMTQPDLMRESLEDAGYSFRWRHAAGNYGNRVYGFFVATAPDGWQFSSEFCENPSTAGLLEQHRVIRTAYQHQQREQSIKDMQDEIARLQKRVKLLEAQLNDCTGKRDHIGY